MNPAFPGALNVWLSASIATLRTAVLEALSRQFRSAS
jgi:hypothetical protein